MRKINKQSRKRGSREEKERRNTGKNEGGMEERDRYRRHGFVVQAHVQHVSVW